MFHSESEYQGRPPKKAKVADSGGLSESLESQER